MPTMTEEFFSAIPYAPARKTAPFFRGRIIVPPGVNASYKIIEYVDEERRLRRRIGPTPELEQFKQDAGWLLKQSRVDWDIVRAIKSARAHTPLAADLRFFFSTRWRRDIDGGVKAALDAAFAHLGLDDRLVVDLHVSKQVDALDPRVELEVSCFV